MLDDDTGLDNDPSGNSSGDVLIELGGRHTRVDTLDDLLRDNHGVDMLYKRAHKQEVSKRGKEGK